MSERLRFGLIPDAANDADADRFVRALSEHLHVEVELQRAIDYRVLVASIEQGRIDLAWVPPVGAARLVHAGAVRPVAVTMRNGSSSYLSGLFALQSSSICTIADLRGVRAAWVDRDSASGYLMIRAALRAAGVSLVTAFSEEHFLRSHSDVARALATGEVDVAATCFNFVSGTVEIARSGYKQHGGLEDGDVRLLAQAGPIPADLLAAHKALPERFVNLVQAALVDARSTQVRQAALTLVHADAFVRPGNEHREMLTALLAAVDRGGTIPPPAF